MDRGISAAPQERATHDSKWAGACDGKTASKRAPRTETAESVSYTHGPRLAKLPPADVKRAPLRGPLARSPPHTDLLAWRP